ncbi:MAG: NAD(P)H-hydrate dehydratase [Mariniblastus sp.]|nr:NAD(P)H-hydrate dehydratase [Mariniblastus sp.]
MINRHDFQQAARHFRSGRLSLNEFTERVFGPVAPDGQAPAEETGYRFPRRKEDAHKGDLGRVLVVGGSVGMAGAAALAGQAALRTGSGLVQVMTPADAQAQVAAFSACLMVLPVATDGGFFGEASVEQILQQCEWADVVALGPGMGRTAAGQQIACQLYEALPQPLVVDADGLNNLADAGVDFSAHQGERILTPHPGEFQRLIGQTESDRQKLEALAVDWAARHELTLILKGHRSLVTDGQQQVHNPTGNSGMATAGCGDLLTGIVASLWGQGLKPWEASRTGCYLHGLAGDLAAGKMGKASLLASDLLTWLPAAIDSVESNV